MRFAETAKRLCESVALRRAAVPLLAGAFAINTGQQTTGQRTQQDEQTLALLRAYFHKDGASLGDSIRQAELLTAGDSISARLENQERGIVARVELLTPDGLIEVDVEQESGGIVVRADGMEENLSNSDVIHRATGIRFSVLESKIRRRIISTDTPYGLMIRSVDPDSPAAAAGIQEDDILLRWNGEPIRTIAHLSEWVLNAVPGDEIEIDCSRHVEDASILNRHPWKDFTATLVLGD